MFQTLRTIVFHIPDLDAAVAWYTKATGVEPYFHEPFYAGFEIGGTELGLDPDPAAGKAGRGGAGPYWRVRNVDEAHAHLLSIGATPSGAIRDVGGGIRVASVLDPFGNVVGVIEIPGEGGTPPVANGHGAPDGASA
jgi:catechol 2,3-dioxygenase-like lactoylglutathione lyase family enzyme